jgi:hypothetical protein
MKKDKETNYFDELEGYPKEFRSLARGVMEQLNTEHPELLSELTLEEILQIVRDEISRVMGLTRLDEAKTVNVSWKDLRSMFRRHLLGMQADQRRLNFEPIANEMGYYSTSQWIQRLNTIQKASKGNIK